MHKLPPHDFERFVRRNLLRAIKLGYSPDEVIDAIRDITARGFEVTPVAEETAALPEPPHASRQGWTQEPGLLLAVTECSLEQSEDLAHDLSRALGVDAVPAVLQVLREDAGQLIGFLGPQTLYVTTPFHQVEVVEILGRYQLEPFILDLSLSREFLEVLKRLEKYHAVGVLCRDEESLAAASSLVRSYLRKSDKVKLIEALVEDADAVNRLISEAEIVIHAPNCRIEAATLLPWGVEKVETTFDTDPESLQELKRLVEQTRQMAAR